MSRSQRLTVNVAHQGIESEWSRTYTPPNPSIVLETSGELPPFEKIHEQARELDKILSFQILALDLVPYVKRLMEERYSGLGVDDPTRAECEMCMTLSKSLYNLAAAVFWEAVECKESRHPHDGGFQRLRNIRTARDALYNRISKYFTDEEWKVDHLKRWKTPEKIATPGSDTYDRNFPGLL
jgi:hypothetical protein